MPAKSTGFYCKSFKPDFDHLAVLLDSFVKHNPDNLELILSLPRCDLAAFADRFGSGLPNLRLVRDEDYCAFDLSRLPGWYSQQICKLASWRVTDADHYAVIDSDCYFIKDVRAEDLTPQNGKDFIVYGSAIRTVLTPETTNDALLAYLRGESLPAEIFPPIRPAPEVDFKELKSHANSSLDALGLAERSGLIFKLFQADQWYFYQPGQLFSSELLSAFEKFLTENGLILAEAISIAPWEYNWYGEYAAAFYSARIDFRVSPMLHFPSKESVDMAVQLGMTEEGLANRFAWIAMAARHHTAFRLTGVDA